MSEDPKQKPGAKWPRETCECCGESWPAIGSWEYGHTFCALTDGWCQDCIATYACPDCGSRDNDTNDPCGRCLECLNEHLREQAEVRAEGDR